MGITHGTGDICTHHRATCSRHTTLCFMAFTEGKPTLLSDGQRVILPFSLTLFLTTRSASRVEARDAMGLSKRASTKTLREPRTKKLSITPNDQDQAMSSPLEHSSGGICKPPLAIVHFHQKPRAWPSRCASNESTFSGYHIFHSP